LKTFFEKNQLSCTFLDGQNKVFYKYKAENEKHQENRHFRAIITNNHIYPITNQLNKFNASEEEIRTNEYFNVKPKKEGQQLFIYDKEELLNIAFSKGEHFTIYYSGDLTETLIWLKYKLKYHLMIKYTKTLTNIYLKVNETTVNFTNYDITFNEEDIEVRMKNEKAKTDYIVICMLVCMLRSIFRMIGFDKIFKNFSKQRIKFI